MHREALEKLFEDSFFASLSAQEQLQVAQIGTEEDTLVLPEELTDEEQEEEPTNIYQIIAEMTVPEKIKLALTGNKVARGLLIRDPQKQIALFVLQNPQFGEGEALDVAKNPNTDDTILRHVANNPNWMKPYSMKLAVCGNAKTPLDVSLRWLKHLKDRDLGRLAKSKDIPQVVGTQAAKLRQKRQK